MSEMVVFTQHENFDFLRFSSRVAKSSVDDFKAECVRVQATQKLTAQSFGVWALRLADLKSAGVWEDVINPETGYAFYNDGFGAFCKHAFGISETATSNLTKIAQFVVNCGDNVGQLREDYKDYSFSQLVELSSVSTDTHKFFKPTMTVKEMRVSKDYVKNSVEFRFEEKGADYDLLSKAQKWKDKDKKPEKPIEVIPGQIDLEDISDSVKMDVIPTSELANASERVSTEEEREELLKNILLFESWRDKRKRLYDKYKGNCSMYEFLLEVKTEYMFKSCSTVKGGDMQANSKGFVISFPGMSEFFVGWEQIASQIVTLINRGEYYTEESVIPTSQVANVGEEEVDIYDMPMQTHSFDSDDYDEADEAYEDMQGEMQTIEQDSEKSLPKEEKEKARYNFCSRTGVRAFLADCLCWKELDCSSPFISCHCYTLKNKRRIYVYVQRTASKNDIERIYEVVHRYFFDLPQYSNVPVEITKEQFEKYCAEHKDEL